MKILLISNKAPYPPKDGASIAVYNMAKGLVDNTAEVHMLPINTKKQFRPDNEIPEEFLAKVNYKSVYRDTDVKALGAFKNLFSKVSYFVSRFYFDAYKEALIEKLQQEDFDIVQIEGVFMACYLPVIRKYSAAKVVLRCHNVEFLIWERYLQSSKNWLKNAYIALQKNRLKTFEIDALNSVDAIVPITTRDEETLKHLAPGKPIFASITGIDLAKYPMISHPREINTMFYFGSMDWLPNVEAVMWFKENCWEYVKANTSTQFKWVIAGINMPAHIKALDKDDRVITISDVPDAFEFYNTFNIQLAPILSGSGLRIKLVEGISYGKPIVTTSIGMEGLDCKDEREVLVADGATAFADKVIRLANNTDGEQRKLSLNARSYAEEHFDNRLITARLLDFYNHL